MINTSSCKSTKPSKLLDVCWAVPCYWIFQTLHGERTSCGPPGKVATALVVIGSGIVSGGVERVTPLRGRALGDYRISPDGPASLAGGPQQISLVHLLSLRCYRYLFAGALTPQVGHEIR